MGFALLGLLSACTGNVANEGGGGGGGGGSIRPGGRGSSFNSPVQFTVRNYFPGVRTETIRASVPFVQGTAMSLDDISVRDMQAAWLPLQYWPDGSVRIAQAQFTDTLEEGEIKTYTVVRNVKALKGSFQPNAWMQQFGVNVRIAARVRDTFGVPYETEVSGNGEVLQETFLCRTRRHRLYHYATQQPNIGRDYLTSTFYVTEFQDMPFMIVDWILGNDYLGADNTEGKTVATAPNYFPLGSIDLRSAEFLARGAKEIEPYLAGKHAIGAPTQDPQGWTSFKVMQDTFIDDGQTRRYRFLIRVTDPQAPAQVEADWARGFDAFVTEPLQPLATLASWQGTRAMGLHGGPIDPPNDSLGRATAEYDAWNNNASFFGSPWATFGDVQYTATTGTPRNVIVSEELAHAVQADYHRLLRMLEQKAWVQAVRPYHLYGLEVGTYQNILLWDEIPYYPGSRNLSAESLGREKLWANDPYSAYRTMVNFTTRAHGWTGYDEEHWTTDLLFDYYTISGDAWAREELRQLGQSLKGLLRLQNYTTAGVQSARAEGWCMVGFVQCYLATSDSSLKDYAILRIDNIIRPAQRSHPSRCFMTQSTNSLTGYPEPHRFYMPWQHGPVVYGYLGALEFFEHQPCLQIIEDVVSAVEYAWVQNFNDPVFGFVANGLRYYVPTQYNGASVPASIWDKTPGIGVKWGCAPLSGAHAFLVSALHLVAEVTKDPNLQSKAIFYANTILGPLNQNKRWYKWNVAVDETFLPSG
jgi:hypothetical protein